MARCPACHAVVDIPPKHAPDHSVVMAREKSDVIDFELFGDEAQYVEITLDPGEVAFAQMQDLFYMDPGIAVEDAAETRDSGRESGTSVFQRISQVGRRTTQGITVPMTAFCNVAERREVVAFAPNPPGRLVPLLMNEFDEQLLCKPDGILCLARGIEIREKDLSSVSPGLSLCELRGDGIAVLQINGQVHHRQMTERDSVNVATDRIVAFTSEVRVSRFETTGVDGAVDITTLRGPGEIWLRAGVS